MINITCNAVTFHKEQGGYVIRVMYGGPEHTCSVFFNNKWEARNYWKAVKRNIEERENDS